MSNPSYTPPVAQLLTYGRAHPRRAWPNYVEELQLDRSHIPELLRMGLDNTLHTAETHSKEVWAPLHAWRALGQLQAIETLDRLIKLVDTLDDDWISAEMSEVVALMGPASLPHLQAALINPKLQEITRCQMTECVAKVGQRYPECRDDCVTLLTQQLQHDKSNGPDINGFVIMALMDLKAAEAELAIRKVFLAGRVDEMITGNWEAVQRELGVQSGVEIPPAPRRSLYTPFQPSFQPISRQKSPGFGSPTTGKPSSGKGKPKKK